MCLCKADAVVDELPKAADNAEQKPKKLTALQSRYSDSDSEETREQRKTRMVVCLCCFSVSVEYFVFLAFGFILQCCTSCCSALSYYVTELFHIILLILAVSVCSPYLCKVFFIIRVFYDLFTSYLLRLCIAYTLLFRGFEII